MINVGSGGIDGLEKLGHEIEAVSGCVEKLLIPDNLIRHACA